MAFLDSACRLYQSLFRHTHPEEAKLVGLHKSGQMEAFLDAYFSHEMEKGREAVARFDRLARGWKGTRVLDFGCGAGGLTFRLAEVCREAVGIDIEKVKVDHAIRMAAERGQENVRFVCYEGGTIPFGDSSFDCIFCVDVIEHLPDPAGFVAQFRRLLKPGGQLLLSFGPPWMHAHGKHMWAQLPGWWTHLMFPQSVVMRVCGFPPGTTWEKLGMHRLTVSMFRDVMRASGLKQVLLQELIKPVLWPLKLIPRLRELFISEVVGVYRKPGTVLARPEAECRERS
ncbi:MAG: class I SAM-dependent methyltransferase [Gemmataceae bacterium]|nr:class I SAM-dependent methyltransferase [Gemmataceae bacterium]